MSELYKIANCDRDTRKADVVFIHGLGGSAEATWRHGEDDATSWPYWLGEDFRDEVGVWSLGYAASPSSLPRLLNVFSRKNRDRGHSMPLPDRAVEVLDLMASSGLGGRPLMLIGHSLGGLLIKQILRVSADAVDDARRQAVFNNTRAVLFLGTPHTGAALASLADAFGALFGTTVSIEDLRAHDPHLRELLNWYRNHSAPQAIETATYYETRPHLGFTIVNATSAHPGVGRDPVPLDEDHLSIAKPRSREARVFTAARDLLRDVVLAPRPTAQERPIVFEAAHINRDGKRIPRQLPPRATAEEFFGRREERAKLTERLRQGKSAAVVGPAGLGKTALAAEAVRDVVGESEAAMLTGPFPDGVVLLDLYQLKARADEVWLALARAFLGPELPNRPPAELARDVCFDKSALIIVEGAEEADGLEGRAKLAELLTVLAADHPRLILTREITQTAAVGTIRLEEALTPDDSSALLDSLTGEPLPAEVRAPLLDLLAGHPLAITWAGSLLARRDENPAWLVTQWSAAGLPSLADPLNAEHTLEWLYGRSVARLGDAERTLLDAAGLLAHAPFPLGAMEAVMPEADVRGGLRCLVGAGLLRRSAETADLWQFTHVLAYRIARRETGADVMLLDRLGRWLHGELTAALKGDGVGQGAISLNGMLLHAGALLRADTNGTLWFPLVMTMLYDVNDRLRALGWLDVVMLSLQELREWFDTLPPTMAAEPYWQRERSVAFTNIGNAYVGRGDLAGALTCFMHAMEIGVQLVMFDPANTDWQRDLGISHNRIGDVLRIQGNLARAQSSYEAGMSIRAWLASADTSDCDWQRDLSISHNKIGDVQLAQGDLVGAQTSYETGMSIRARLAMSDLLNTDWQRDLSISYNKIGDVQLTQGDLAGARLSYEAGMSIRARLAASDSSNTGWQRDLGFIHIKIGDVQRIQGNLAEARLSYEEGMLIRTRLAMSDSTNTGWQHDLSISYNKIGDIRRVQGNLVGARANYEGGMSIRAQLAMSDPTNTEWQCDIGVSHNRIGDVQLAQGDLAGALSSYESGMSIRARLAISDSTNMEWQRDLSISHTKIGDVRLAQRNLAGARSSYEQGMSIRSRLASSDPSNTAWQRDLSIGHQKIGDVQLAQGDLVGARLNYEAGMSINTRLASSDPSNTVWQRDLSHGHQKIGDVQRAQGDLAGAQASYEYGIEIAGSLATSDPTNTDWQRDLFYSYTKLADVAEALHDTVTALRHAEVALEIDERLARLDPTNVIWQKDVRVSRAQVERLRGMINDE